ncbi:MAG: hypothetical protein ACFFDS_03500 [Candidatus Thorarchaeota archaeon]
MKKLLLLELSFIYLLLLFNFHSFPSDIQADDNILFKVYKMEED